MTLQSIIHLQEDNAKMSSCRLVQNNGGSGGGWSRFGEYDQMNESKLMRRKGTWTRVERPLLSKSVSPEH